MQEIRVLVVRVLKNLGRRFALPIAIVLACLLAGLGYGLFKAPTYSATAYVLVVSDPDGGPAAVNFAQAYGRLASMRETLGWAAKPIPSKVLDRSRAQIQASSSPDTPLVRLTASASTAMLSAELANTAADALVRYGNAHQHDTGVRVAPMTQASVPPAPSSPNLPLNVAVGVATGLLLGGLVAATGVASRIRAWFEAALASAAEEIAAADKSADGKPKPKGSPLTAEAGQ
jgi:capsular polysaccharide biosynthesis protein